MPPEFVLPGFIFLVAVAAFAAGWMNGRWDHYRAMAALEARKDAERKRALALWQDLAWARWEQLSAHFEAGGRDGSPRSHEEREGKAA